MTTQVAERYRLVTRSDFDGLVCAALLKELGILDDILFVHPKDMQDGKVEIDRPRHHHEPALRPGRAPVVRPPRQRDDPRRATRPRTTSSSPGAQSAARVVYDYYGGADVFPRIGEDMMDAVDKADAAEFSPRRDPRAPGLGLLNFLMDPRTGLGRFREFRISNYQLMMQLIDASPTKSIDEILETPGRRRARRALPRARRAGRRPDRRAAHRSTATSWCSTSATRR